MNRLFGLFVVQNEEDIIEDLLEFHKKLGLFEAIFFYDLGSQDNTFSKALRFKDILYEPQVLDQPYTEKLRYDLLDKHRSLYEKGDWLAFVDADEFYVDDPRELIRQAESQNANCIRTYQIGFRFTDIDLKNFETEDESVPIYERRKYYLIDWSEPRFFKFLDQDLLFSTSNPCSKRLLNRHYPNRTPEQIRTRIQTRLANREKTRHLRGRQEWQQVYSANWKDYVVPHQILHQYDGGDFRFGLPGGVAWKDYFSKDPFTSVTAQVAKHLEIERADSLKSENKNSGKISFEDCYRQNVLKQIREDLSCHRWSIAFQGLLVLLRYDARHAWKALPSKWMLRTFKIKNHAWTALNTLKRILRGQSVGLLTASPNPLEVPDISGAGITTLKWKSIKTRKVELRIDSPEGVVICSGESSGTFQTGGWVANDMVFYLQDASDHASSFGNTLSKVTIKVLTGKTITL